MTTATRIVTTTPYNYGDQIFEGGYEYEVVSCTEVSHPTSKRKKYSVHMVMVCAMDTRPVLNGTTGFRVYA